jgi:DNA-directed RNA polymerase specialized sigma24 family protein
VASGERPARERSKSTDRPVRESVEETYIRLRPPLVRLAHLLTGSVDLAEDVVHDAFVSCSQRWSTLDIADAYVRRAVINHAPTSRPTT